MIKDGKNVGGRPKGSKTKPKEVKPKVGRPVGTFDTKPRQGKNAGRPKGSSKKVNPSKLVLKDSVIQKRALSDYLQTAPVVIIEDGKQSILPVPEEIVTNRVYKERLKTYSSIKEALFEEGFDVIKEIVILFRDKNTSAKDKKDILNNLVPYCYPKLINVDGNINSTSNVITVEYVEETLDFQIYDEIENEEDFSNFDDDLENDNIEYEY